VILVVFTYNDEESAANALAHIASLKQENVQKALIGVEDAAVVVKNSDGKLKVRQTLESAVKTSNVASGGLWGLVIGFLFGGPLVGALLGLGAGALLGRKIDIGIDNDFINGIDGDLNPGNSALFLLVKDTPAETVAEALSQFNGTLYHTSFAEETQAVFEKALENETVRDAAAGHHETE
jgi:uncharacterized membrane protein